MSRLLTPIRECLQSSKEKCKVLCGRYKKAYITDFPSTFIQKKRISTEILAESKLKRCLSIFDVTLLGIGSTLGLGIYVLAGQVASDTAGPSVVISFLIAAIASVFAGLCYAEFGARVPKAGSAYVYSYVTVGELIAFIIGWNLILEYAIGTASVARGYSGYIDSLLNKTIETNLKRLVPMYLPHMASYPDFLAFGITMLLTVMLSLGAKESSKFNNIFTGINLLVVVYVVICGSFKADIHNWELSESEVHSHGDGGFFPFGVSGMLTGAATCFYGFVGFDCIATLGEEVKNPQRAIPLGIVLSLLIVFLAYFGVSAIQTLMWPYWDQNTPAPLPDVFAKVGWISAKWIISIGALAGLSTSLLGGMFPLPRILYAMANDGLIFRFLANIHPKFQTPFIATYLSGLLAAIMAMLFNVKELASMMSIGTLLAYTLVAISILILRYQKPIIKRHSCNYTSDDELSDPNMTTEINSCSLIINQHPISFKKCVFQLWNSEKLIHPTNFSSKVSTCLIVIIVLLIVCFDLLIYFFEHEIVKLNIFVITGLAVVIVILIILVSFLCLQPVNQEKLTFQVPLMPFTPILSVFINAYLMIKLNVMTWTRFGVWMALGFLIYFSYGIINSSERSDSYRPPSEQRKHEKSFVETEDTPLIE